MNADLIYALTLLLLLVYLVLDWFSRTSCPHCDRLVLKKEIQAGLPCSKCGYVLGEKEQESPDSESVCNECVICSSSMKTAKLFRLWDENYYCLECLQRVAPELIEVGRDEFLRENMPYSLPPFALKCILFFLSPIFCFVTLLMIFAADSGEGFDPLETGAAFLHLLAPIGLWMGLCGTISLPLASPQVTLWEGKLVSRIWSSLSVVPLEECRWRRSFPSHISGWKLGFLLPGECFIISYDDSTAAKAEEEQIAVGFTAETRKVWESFFRLIDLPETMADESKWSGFGRQNRPFVRDSGPSNQL